MRHFGSPIEEKVSDLGGLEGLEGVEMDGRLRSDGRLGRDGRLRRVVGYRVLVMMFVFVISSRSTPPIKPAKNTTTCTMGTSKRGDWINMVK